jgi:hypothetical protein
VGVLAAVAAVITAAALSWATLCLGEDGHVAFEVAVAGKCLDDGAGIPAARSLTILNACVARPGCGPCTDLRWTSTAWLGSATSDLPDPGPAHVSVTLAPIAMPLANPASFRLAAVVAGAHLGATATTVLRC